jgi:hypothetical protein
LAAIVENIVVSLPHVDPIIFHHMDPIMFQARMKDHHDVPHANSILQHFTTTFIEFNMIPVTMEMIVTTSTNMNWIPLPTISSPIIMYPSLKDVLIICNLKQKQHAMFMLTRRMLFNSYDNFIPTKKNSLDLVEMQELVKVMSSRLY